VGESKEIDEREYPLCTNSKGLPPKQVTFGGVSRKKYNNLIVTDDEEEEVVDDEIFFDSEDNETLGEFDSIENAEEEE
jgi:hypothetical protein